MPDTVEQFGKPIIGRKLLYVLSIGERHDISLAVLVRENNHYVAPMEVRREFIWQSIHSRLIRDGTLTGSNYDEHILALHLRGKRGQMIPMLHAVVFSTNTWMGSNQIVLDSHKRVISTMEQYAAIKIACQSRQALKPAVKAWFKLRT